MLAISSLSLYRPRSLCLLLSVMPLVFFSLLITGCDSSSSDAPSTGGSAGVESGGAAGVSGGDQSMACLSDARCLDGVRQTCSEGEWTDDECLSGEVCDGDGACIPQPNTCDEEGAARCLDATQISLCVDGMWENSQCEGGCLTSDEGASCQEVICVPGERRCRDTDTIVECNAVGSEFRIAERCRGLSTGQQCDLGECVPLCLISEKVKTNIGCDYWAADLDNAFVESGEGFLDAAAAPFAVVVSNPHPEFTGEVSVYDHEGLIDQAILPPLGLHIFNLPRRDIEGTTLAPLSYRIRSGVPIVAYQFNPLENEDVFSNDASLLLPSHVVGEDYLVMTREQSFDRLRGYVTILGISDEPTTVTVTVTAPTQSGPIGDIPELNPGDTYEVTLSAFDVLSLQTRAPGADLTGTRVTSDKPVVVFGGSEAANVPNTNRCININERTRRGVCDYDQETECSSTYDCNNAFFNVCCADHLEQQMFPINTWGRHYIATKSFDRGLELDYWRILASEDNTKVETVPPLVDIPTLNTGEWFEFGSREHFEIISDKPVLVGQFLAGEHAPEPNIQGGLEPGDAGTGDPAFILAVPNTQFRNDFVFLAPNKYAFDYVSVIAPVGAEVFFDDRLIESWESVGETMLWQVARFPIGDGVHLLIADEPIGVLVYGYDSYVSYGYPGGLNLDIIDPETGEATTPPAEGGSETAGTESAGTESAGTESAGTESAGTESAGTESAGTESAGTESAGTGSAGTESAGTGSAGTGSAGGISAGSESTGAEMSSGAEGAGAQAGASE